MPGVIRLLGNSQSDTVSKEEIDRIREGLLKGYVLRPHPSVPVGTAVRVRSGVFEGAKGTVTELRQRCNVVIALSAVKQCFSLEVGIDDIEVLTPNASSAEWTARFGSNATGRQQATS